jgi:hypothetical protein
MNALALPLVIVCGLASPVFSQERGAPAPGAATQEAASRRPLVQLAILLDTSGSMDGLIEQAKSQLWSVVNQFATAKHSGRRPELQVALYEYGKQSIPASEGYLRMILPLSTDLDAVSEQLFALRTNGGEEYCGRAIKAAAESLAWGAEAADLRLIVIAGNEPFTQGDVDYQGAVHAAVKKGIIVNTIHCGPREVGIQTQWEDGAKLGEGTYSFIDQGAAVVHIPSPQDEEITRLGSELNTTYLAYGDEGVRLQARQEAQDRNAMGAAPAAPVQRAVSKSGDMYRNASWDLVDAVREKQVKLEALKDEQLPEAMRKMSQEERAKYVQEMGARRGEVQKKIQTLEAERQKFVAVKMREQSGQDTTLGAALLTSLRAQAEKKGYAFEKP